uniref:CXADR-like membrane protein n=1 Tax=Astyanax mexicanus TaxID=7994 RepID=A0A3B1K4F7_ASTMX
MSPQRSANITAAVILILLAAQQGTMDQQVLGYRVSKLTCSPTCSGNCYYSWLKQRWISDYWHTDEGYWQHTPTSIGCSTTATVWIDSTSSSIQDKYSCNVYTHVYSLPYCELGEQQWDVMYNLDSVCALEGSSVDLFCIYKHPGGLTVTASFWFINDQPGVGPVDLRDDDQYKGRVQYYQNQNQLYHTVTITDLRANDAQTYKFRFITDDPDGKYTDSSGIRLSVTGLKIEVSDTQGGGKKLICRSTCTLTNPTYIWYRNEQPVSEQNRAVLYLRDRTVDAGSYSCAVKGHEEIRSAAVCGFEGLQVKVEGATAALVEGQTVTLTCSSMCSQFYSNYTWYRNRQAVSEQNRSVEALGTGQNYSITNISSQHSGLYYCTALNQLGQHSSALARLDVFSDWWKQYAVWAAVGLVPALALSLLTAVLCVQRKRRAERGADVQTPKPGDDTYTALNLATTSSSEYDTLTHATHSPSDTYSTLNPATRTSSEYDTLTHATHSANDTYSTLNPATRTSSEYDTLMVVGPPPVQSGAPDEENN